MQTEPLDRWFDPAATTFGDRIAGAREQAGMTQQDLAKRMGIKLKTLKSWEEDLSEPRANKLSMMAGLLNVSLTWLLSGEGNGPDAPGALVQGATDILSEIRDVRSQVERSSDRLARLETALLAVLQEEELA